MIVAIMSVHGSCTIKGMDLQKWVATPETLVVHVIAWLGRLCSRSMWFRFAYGVDYDAAIDVCVQSYLLTCVFQ